MTDVGSPLGDNRLVGADEAAAQRAEAERRTRRRLPRHAQPGHLLGAANAVLHRLVDPVEEAVEVVRDESLS